MPALVGREGVVLSREQGEHPTVGAPATGLRPGHAQGRRPRGGRRPAGRVVQVGRKPTETRSRPTGTRSDGTRSGNPRDDRDTRAEESRAPFGEAGGGWATVAAWERRPRVAPGKREGEPAPMAKGPTDAYADSGTYEPEQRRIPPSTRCTPGWWYEGLVS